MTKEEEEKEKRFQEALKRPIVQRMMVMYTLLEGYRLYMIVESSRHLSMSDMDYERAESMSEAFEKVIGLQVDAKFFLHDKEEEVNKSIDAYTKLKELLKENLDEDLHEAAFSFFKNIFYRDVSPYFKLGGYRTYAYTLAALLNYVVGEGTKEEVWDSMIMINPFTQTARRVDSSLFRRDITKMFYLFVEIIYKQKARRKKKASRQ